MEFQIIDLKTIDYSIAEKLELPTDISKTPVTIGVRLYMFYRPDASLLVQHLRVVFNEGDVEMVRLTVQAAYHVPGLPASAEDLRAYAPVSDATLMTAGIVDGVLSEKLSMTPLSTLHMPVPDIKRLLEKAEIRQLD